MGITGIGSNAASWAQFVKLTQAARERNGGLTADGAAANKADAVSFKRAANVYLSDNPLARNQGVQAAQAETRSQSVSESLRMLADINPLAQNQGIYASKSIQNIRKAGGLFDAYA